MTSTARKGWTAEHLFVDYAREQGFIHAERRRLAGREDRGDITGIPGIAWQIKNRRKYEIGPWLAETQAQARNAHADYGILVVKPPGLGRQRIGEWPAILTLAAAFRLLGEAGYR